MGHLKTSKNISFLLKLTLVVLILQPLLWYSNFSSYQYTIHIPGIEPKVVWDFVADLNHLRVSDKGVKSMEIMSDLSVDSEWLYSARLTEERPHIGQLYTYGDYIVKRQDYRFIISNTYRTCKSVFCAHGNSTMTFEKDPQGTTISERLHINMPWICQLVVGFSKVAALHESRLDNIRYHFVSRNIKYF